MGHGFLRFLTALLLGGVGTSTPAYSADQKIILTTHNLFPYSYQRSDGEFVGLAADVVNCVMKKLSHPYEIGVVPWKRAQVMVQKNKAAGFFAGSRNTSREGYAVMSKIIAEQNWMWYLGKNTKLLAGHPDFKARMVTSSFIGANMQKWLEVNGYRTIENIPRDTQTLLKMLLANRIDAALANEQVMQSLLAREGVTEKVRPVLNRNKPLGVYFSKSFLATRPGFLKNFDSHVDKCRQTAVQSIYEP